MESQYILLIGMAALMFFVIGGISLIAHYYTLNGIKSKTVGDGQHGTARFATKKEILKLMSTFHLMFQIGGKEKNLPTEQGIIVGCKGS